MISIPLQGFHKGAHPRAKCLQLVSPRGLETSELVFTVPDPGIQRTNSPSGVEGERGDKMECQLIFVFPGSSKCWQATSWRVGGRGQHSTYWFSLISCWLLVRACSNWRRSLAAVLILSSNLCTCSWSSFSCCRRCSCSPCVSCWLLWEGNG